FVIAEASLQMFQDYPLGVGYRNYPDVSPAYLDAKYLTIDDGVPRRAAHNSYFSVLCETGIVGFGFWTCAILGTMWMLRTMRRGMDRERPTVLEVYALGFEIGLYGWLVAGLTYSLHEVDPAYWMMAFGVIITRLAKQDRRVRVAADTDLEDAGEETSLRDEDHLAESERWEAGRMVGKP